LRETVTRRNKFTPVCARMRSLPDRPLDTIGRHRDWVPRGERWWPIIKVANITAE
jgi:hypothetical protein